jgi:hypothetical protein
LPATLHEDTWSFSTSRTTPGIYTIWVQAVDQAGNTITVGSFIVTVTTAYISYFPAFFKK